MTSEPDVAERIKRRDIVLLPMIAALTLLALGSVAEIVSRLCWPAREVDACEMKDAAGWHFRPNCRSTIKLDEGSWVENAYNECGFRSRASCGPKPPKSLRVAVLGSSVSRGFWVSYRESFAGRAEDDLTRACGRPVEFQNLSLSRDADAGVPVWHTIADRTTWALALGPDAIVLVVTPFDLEQYTSLPGTGHARTSPAPSDRAWIKRNVVERSRFILAAERVVYSDLDRYVPLFLQHGDGADFLRPPFTRLWTMRLRIADTTIGRIAHEAEQARVPLLVVYMPNRVQAALSGRRTLPAGVDPFALGRDLSAVAARHRAAFADMTLVTEALPDTSADYFPVDGHPTGGGHAILAGGVERLLRTDVPAFAGCRPVDQMRADEPGAGGTRPGARLN